MDENQLPDIKDRLIHRDLSWLSFNERVLEEASAGANPFLERLRFLAIFANNLDEFTMVRVAGLKRLIDSQYNDKDSFGYYPQDLLAEIKTRTDALTKRAYEIYNKFRKDLEKNTIFIRDHEELNAEQKKFVKRFFDTTLFPIITPMAVDQGRPFPVLPSKTLAWAVSLSRKDQLHMAIIPIPKNIPRLLRVPAEKDETCFIFIDEIILQNIKNFFRGYNVEGTTLFRLIRDSELSVEEEGTPDLLKAIEGEVRKRTRAKIVLLEIEKACSAQLLESLCLALDYPKDDVVSIPGNLDLTFFYELVRQTERPDLCYRAFARAKIDYENIFDKINDGDFITHLPFQSFYPTVDLIQSAARDENVLAIKMTLYRTNEDSAIIKGLKDAAKNKKQVTVLVEIKARFDEEKNINWAKELEEAGCHVIYGIAGLKIHSKMTLIVRKHEGRIRRYVHLSSGNYNENTAKAYTDIGYFTVNDDFARDISDVFNVITGYSIPSPWKRIVSSPSDLRQYFFELINKEIDNQKKYKNGLVFAKMNSLEDPGMIEKLYEASAAGVRVKLIVRGICCLIPGVAGLSENIEVKSIVGRFLEHSRIFLFNNNSAPRIFLASADWMSRNLDRRIEILFEISKDEIKEHLQILLDTYWKDTVKARVLLSGKNYVRPADTEEKFNAQEFLINHYGGQKV
ncbi:MAG: polyphosphate kinase 1 [Candidatus Omnitrophota bacterium]|nr:polyphosphate kinase 1 [Candidatus Omnitrophota bacterium]MDZ4243235.1 polyphosphate kinase 1 [Candidatus Omnitrophota bacterium]